MDEPASDKRLRPSLLDRLTDLHPEQRTESRQELAVTEGVLREQVRRDLIWLFNTTQFEAGSSLDLTAYPHVRSSVLNYGLCDLTGQTLSSIRPETLERHVQQSLQRYESRLLPESIQVTARVGKRRLGVAALVVEIQAALHAEPLPLSLRLRTEIDIESGRVTIGDAPGHQGE